MIVLLLISRRSLKRRRASWGGAAALRGRLGRSAGGVAPGVEAVEGREGAEFLVVVLAASTDSRQRDALSLDREAAKNREPRRRMGDRVV